MGSFDAKYKVVERSPTKSPRPSPNKNTSPTYRGRFHEERRIEEMKNRIDEITKEQQKYVMTGMKDRLNA